MSRTRARGVVACLLAALVLGACGKSDDAPPPASAATPTPPKAAASTSDAPAGSDADSAPSSACAELQTDWSHATAPAGLRYVISRDGLGPVRLGMTIDEARAALPPDYRFERGSDGEGVPWVDVFVGQHALMSLHANEEDVDAPIDGTLRIDGIQSFSKATVTAEGVAVGDLLADAEQAYGPVRDIVESEIESRQIVEFTRGPILGLRIDYSGDFPPGSRHTTRYCPGARIYAMATWVGYE
jgi:hypothetical protein